MEVASRFTDAGFGIKDIAVAGNERTSKESALEALGVGKGESIFAVSPKEARARLLALPWVSDAEVKREFPDGVSIRLIEKRPFALWRTNAGVVVVERTGAVITAAKPDAFARLPMLAGAGAPEAAAPFIDALRSLKAVSARVQTMDRRAG
jgi:cell division protein FtsQ